MHGRHKTPPPPPPPPKEAKRQNSPMPGQPKNADRTPQATPVRSQTQIRGKTFPPDISVKTEL